MFVSCTATASKRVLSQSCPSWLFQVQRRTVLSGAVSARVASIVEQHDLIMEKLTQGDTSVGKQLSSLVPVAKLNEKLVDLSEEEQSFNELLEEALAAKDRELEDDCRQELERIVESRAHVEKRVLDAILPKDDADDGDAVLEIRAGTGGDEAALFAAELLEAYSKTARSQGFKVETLEIGKTPIGGVKSASLSINGKGGSFGYSGNDEDAQAGPYAFFKYESGVHRVQRVPVNDVRIQTSAASVAVLPSPTEIESGVLLPMNELKIETMRSQGAGGQHVNTTDSAVRITHIPTGLTAAIQDERSQHKNRDKAMKLIAARVTDIRRQEAARERGDARTSLLGSGDRSERIRTYNFPQDRVTDHRCKETTNGIARLFAGTEEDNVVATFAPFLRNMSREKLLQEIERES